VGWRALLVAAVELAEPSSALGWLMLVHAPSPLTVRFHLRRFHDTYGLFRRGRVLYRCSSAAAEEPSGEEAFKSMEGNFTWRLEASQRRVFVQEQQCECTGAAQLRFEVPMQKRLFPGDWRPV